MNRLLLWLTTGILVLGGFTGSVPALDDEADEILRRCVREMIAVKPGTAPYDVRFRFGGGDAAESKEVEMRETYTISTVETTQELWQIVMGENPSRWKGDRNSVEMVSFDDCVVFCEKLTTRLRELELIEADAFVRLPTELEWEYAARAGTDTAYSFGDDSGMLGDYAWYTGNAAGNDPPVAAKRANAAGLYDVHGYLWEWCLPGEGNAEKLRSAKSWAEIEGEAVLRSGSWKHAAELLRSDSRRPAPRGLKDDAVGLRLLLVGKHKAPAQP